MLTISRRVFERILLYSKHFLQKGAGRASVAGRTCEGDGGDGPGSFDVDAVADELELVELAGAASELCPIVWLI
jgi:hypothetical protein